ncbi:hypothetical protein V6N11_018210 [Hibiscus sabdariffa]|uniref:Uncharacterized protein n=1 Tax=Hibiscus sabdariffa TaxID=183260 RepID=A0ABR2T7M8_9ROSI
MDNKISLALSCSSTRSYASTCSAVAASTVTENPVTEPSELFSDVYAKGLGVEDTFPCLLELRLEWSAIMKRIWQGLLLCNQKHKIVQLIEKKDYSDRERD